MIVLAIVILAGCILLGVAIDGIKRLDAERERHEHRELMREIKRYDQEH